MSAGKDDELFASGIIKSESDLPERQQQQQQPRDPSNLFRLTSHYGTPPERSHAELVVLDAVDEVATRSNTDMNISQLEQGASFSNDDRRMHGNLQLAVKQDDYFTGSQTSLYQDNIASEPPKTSFKIQINSNDIVFDGTGISTKSSPLAPLKKSSSIRVLARPGYHHQSGSLDNFKQASYRDLARLPVIRVDHVNGNAATESLSSPTKSPSAQQAVSSPLFMNTTATGLSHSASKVKSLDKLLAGEIEITKIKKSPSRASNMSNVSRAIYGPDGQLLSSSQTSLHSNSQKPSGPSKNILKSSRSNLLGYSMPVITTDRHTNHRKAYRAENQEVYVDIDASDDSASDYDFYSKKDSSDEDESNDFGDYDFYSEHSSSDDSETVVKTNKSRLTYHKVSQIGVRKGLGHSLNNIGTVIDSETPKMVYGATAQLQASKKRQPQPDTSVTESLPTPSSQLKKSDSTETLAPTAQDSSMYQYLAEGKLPQSQVEPPPRYSSDSQKPRLKNYYMQESVKDVRKAKDELFSPEDDAGLSDTMKRRTKSRLKQKKTATISIRKGMNVPIGTQSQIPTVADKVALMESQHIFALPWFNGKRNMRIPKALQDPKVRRQLMQLTIYNPRFTLGMIIINIILFLFQLLHAYITVGEVFQMSPMNIMIGPRPELLVALGGRFVPCMKTGFEEYRYDCSVFYPKTTPSRVRKCGIDEFCAVLGTKTETPNQLWRLLTAMFLHAGVLHLLSNVIFLWQIGSRLERTHGPRRIAVIYLLSGFGGFLFGSNLTTFTVTVGASGAIYGLLGCNLLDLFFNFQIVPNRWWELTSLLFSILIYLGVGLLPNIDNFAHIGGFVIGILCGLYMLKPIKFGNTDRIAKTALKVLSLPVIGGAFIYLFVQFFSSTNTCKWCKYLDCLPINGWCDDSNYYLNSL